MPLLRNRIADRDRHPRSADGAKEARDAATAIAVRPIRAKGLKRPRRDLLATRHHAAAAWHGRQYLTRPEAIMAYVEVSKQMITHEPALMLSAVSALVWPSIHVELEVEQGRRGQNQ